MPNTNQQPDKSAAALAFATMLSEQLLKQQNPIQPEGEPMQTEGESVQEGTVEAPQAPEMTPGEEMARESLQGPVTSEEPRGDPVLEAIETLKEEGLSRAKVKKAMNQMIDEAYVKENS